MAENVVPSPHSHSSNVGNANRISRLPTSLPAQDNGNSNECNCEEVMQFVEYHSPDYLPREWLWLVFVTRIISDYRSKKKLLMIDVNLTQSTQYLKISSTMDTSLMTESLHKHSVLYLGLKPHESCLCCCVDFGGGHHNTEYYNRVLIQQVSVKDNHNAIFNM